MKPHRYLLISSLICAVAIALPTLIFWSVAHFNLTDMEPVTVIKPKFDLLSQQLPQMSTTTSGIVSALSLLSWLLALRLGKSFARSSLAVLLTLLAWNSLFILGEPALYFQAIQISTEAFEHHFELAQMMSLIVTRTAYFSTVIAIISGTFAILISLLMFRQKTTR